MSTSTAEPVRRRAGLAGLQRLGRSLMLPIAVLPAAGLLLRLGQDDLLGGVEALKQPAAVLAAAGGALFDHLPMIFAVGIAIGWARRSDGSTALAALVGYLVMDGVFTALSPVLLPGVLDSKGEQATIDFGVLGGIVAGLVAALLWQRFHRTTLPTFLGFFNGRRLVPILTAVSMMVIASVMSLVYPVFNAGLTGLGTVVGENAVVGGGIFGLVNRLLLPIGLHHIVNNVVWFLIGDYQGVHGDLQRFFQGDPTAGTFMTGFFPIMMFALPAAALAIWHEARPERRKLVGGIMVSVALTSFVTGITEPLEYAFVYVAWPLYLIHAVLTGTSLALVNALDIHSGFAFSAGAIDYVLNFGQSTRPLWLIPIGLAYAVVYYVLFRFVIRRWNLRTPGREDDETTGTETTPATVTAATTESAGTTGAAGDTDTAGRADR
ncbi:PTS system, N-acetylglucosamine-specific IIB component / PTS system, N-acetylglucosamine-specific IIC component [Pseudonocardia sp. Ae406_Ps2]|uniref:PTS transporter subunit EIIC n=1 Tax=unclassified Pseudonocardia TaxID=2619320 RepID=UPI00094B254C|nr:MULTISPECIES: PTS transporter subunit EIIC [unclassified Pseudonocardia]OLM02209.1 PTS system, N-acetylglucosamine-specific IIB component / PTS system, N-acetylglucosamine-specific IIC component [Pseudonocardia sp. Ae406_Ps2]OLM06008.1 PTS system, N-acetylglucosamine-specific IIB component / PTS system, N-acetylglucosamine-specific IIC component [Pseudonocardia sp. Ae331_Ps2]OLM23781.1 PTS system, N-acetylglucosamine-specific IIB component / PTS system, N-acetylglucosamine-specific IIC compon